MISGLFWMLVANAASLLAGHALVRKLSTGDGAVDALLLVLLRLLLVSAAVLIAGLSGGLRPLALGVTGTLVLAGLLASGEHRRLLRCVRPEMGAGTAILLALVGLRLLAQVWCFAPYSSDALSYRLPLVAEWIQAGGFTRELGVDLCAPLPAGFELIEAWWVVFLHHDVLIEMGGVEFAILALFAVRVLALRLGLSSRAAWLAGTLYVLTPLFSLQSTSCLNDSPVAALVLSLAALVMSRVHPLLLLIPAGLIGGIKATGCFTFPAWILLLVLRRQEPPLRTSSLPLAAGAAALAVATGGFWYLRNLIWWGNPLYPVGVNDPIFGQILVQTGPSAASLGANLADLLNSRIYDRTGPLVSLSTQSAGWGALAFACGGVGAVGEIRTNRAFRHASLAFVLALATVLMMVTPDLWMARFVLFFPGILCVAAARLAEALRPAAVLVGIGALLEFGAAILPADLSRDQWAAMLRQPWRERSSAAFYEGVPPGDAVGVHIRTRKPLSFLYGPDYARRVVYFRLASAEALPAEMERLGLKVLYVDRSNRRRKDFDELLRQGRLRAQGNSYYVVP